MGAEPRLRVAGLAHCCPVEAACGRRSSLGGLCLPAAPAPLVPQQVPQHGATHCCPRLLQQGPCCRLHRAPVGPSLLQLQLPERCLHHRFHSFAALPALRPPVSLQLSSGGRRLRLELLRLWLQRVQGLGFRPKCRNSCHWHSVPSQQPLVAPPPCLMPFAWLGAPPPIRPCSSRRLGGHPGAPKRQVSPAEPIASPFLCAAAPETVAPRRPVPGSFVAPASARPLIRQQTLWEPPLFGCAG